jgi:hypothetical protein
MCQMCDEYEAELRRIEMAAAAKAPPARPPVRSGANERQDTAPRPQPSAATRA